MKTRNRILIGLAAASLVGAIIFVIRKKNTRKMLKQIADEGYETAHDILFPNKSKRDSRLQYGPVIPAE